MREDDDELAHEIHSRSKVLPISNCWRVRYIGGTFPMTDPSSWSLSSTLDVPMLMTPSEYQSATATHRCELDEDPVLAEEALVVADDDRHHRWYTR
jgi:hypothetical protein